MIDIPPELIRRLQVTASIDAIERYCDLLVDLGPDKYLQIKYELIKQLENDAATSTL